MAKVISHSVNVTFSLLVKNSQVISQDYFKERVDTLNAALDEVFGNDSGLIVEIEESNEDHSAKAQKKETKKTTIE